MTTRWTLGVLVALGGWTGCASPQDAGDATASVANDSYDPEDPIEGIVRCGARSAQTVDAGEWAINATAEAELGLALLDELGAQEDNVLVSPMSLRSAFGQVYAGTSGTSRTEIAQVFGFEGLGERTHAVVGGAEAALLERNVEPDEETQGLVFRPANRSYFDLTLEDGIDPAWQAIVQRDYGACVELFDLNADHDETMAHVNGWVANQTNDLIPNLVKWLPDQVTLILVNALYFKAAWASPFEESATAPRPFTTRSGSVVDVPTMHAPTLRGRYAGGEGWQAVAMPYTDARLEMIVILPESADFEASLDAAALEDVFAALEPSVVDLSLPKLDILSTWSLRDALMAMGLSNAFTRGEDFLGIARGMMPIAAVFHDVAMVIDENGTEAAAATAVVFGEDGGGEEPIADHTVVVDRTYYIAIRDREVASLMFFARIGDPSTGA